MMTSEPGWRGQRFEGPEGRAFSSVEGAAAGTGNCFTKRTDWFILGPMAELRKDPVSGNWIVSGYTRVKSGDIATCPFCPGNEHLTPPAISQVKDKDGNWLVRCFPASNPIFMIEVAENKRAEGLYDKMGNVGAHEIIVEGRVHTKTTSTFEPHELGVVLDMFAGRIIDLKKDKRFKYVQVFKNHGELAGSYIFHPHSHVLATPIMPHRMTLELTHCRNHYLQKERCLICDIVNQEMRQEKRVVAQNDHFVAFCPFASRFPYELWVVPRRHGENFEAMRDGEARHQFIALFLDVMKRIEMMTTAYTFVIHTSPNIVREGAGDEDFTVADYFHWHIEVLPRDFRSSKYKREDEFYIVSVPPEEAAERLRAEKV